MGPYTRHFAAMDLPSSCSSSIHWCPVQLWGEEYFLEFPGIVILCVSHVDDCICSMKIIPAPAKQTNKKMPVEYVCCWTHTAQTLTVLQCQLLTSWGCHRGWHRFLFWVWEPTEVWSFCWYSVIWFQMKLADVIYHFHISSSLSS